MARAGEPDKQRGNMGGIEGREGAMQLTKTGETQGRYYQCWRTGPDHVVDTDRG